MNYSYMISFYYIFIKIYRLIIWHLQFYRIRRNIKKNKIEKLPKKKIILLIPHSDDEWMTNSQIVQHAEELLMVNMDMNGNDSEELHFSRFKEMSHIAKQYNRKLETLTINKQEGLSSLLDTKIDSLILVPYFFDWHVEHLHVIEILYKALKDLKDIDNLEIAMYPVSCPMPFNVINRAIVMDKFQWSNKWKMFLSNYKTQQFIPYKRFSLYDRIYGAFLGQYAAEVYCMVSAKKWIASYDKFSVSDIERKTFLKNLNDLEASITFSNKLYEERILSNIRENL